MKLLTLLVACGIGLAVLVSDQRVTVVPPPPALPPAVVTLGDSTLSGEGGGDYDPATDGLNGDWCHRSSHAPVFDLNLPPAVTPINLACSGAQAAQVGDAADPEAAGTQTAQLAGLAKRYQIRDVIVQVGANDDPDFGDAVNKCVAAWVSRSPGGCASELASQWPQHVQQMEPKVLSALRAVRAVLTRAGYRQDSYSLVLQSYASPVEPGVRPDLQNLSGCPLLSDDVRWIRQTAVPQLSDGLRQVAQEANARFLDLSRAGDGHGACSGNVEWFTRLTVDWQSLKDDNRAQHAMQESFHPNRDGQAEIGRCLGQFLALQDRTDACVADERGNLMVGSDQTAALQAGHP